MNALLQRLIAFKDYGPAPGILLGLAAVISLVMVNSPLFGLYDSLLHTPVAIKAGSFEIYKPLLLWINDGLMAVFFLLVGLEIKRETISGHLSTPQQCILPAIAALGGIVFPALIYYAFNHGNPETIGGWAIPAATDIAFALGVIMLLGNRIPTALKVTLVTIAVIDDLAAVIIIAIFYTADLSYVSLAVASVCIIILVTLNRFKVASLVPYILVGLILWASVLKSGVHATLAGVVLGLCIPYKVQNKDGKSPAKHLEHSLHPWVNFGVLPIFAFANAGISFSGMSMDSFSNPITLGVLLGLFLGKQLGVMLFTAVSVALGICKLPDQTNWKQYYGMALLTGIGFTMSFFIGTLAFETQDALTSVRLGVLCGSALSGVLGYMLLRAYTTPRPYNQNAA